MPADNRLTFTVRGSDKEVQQHEVIPLPDYDPTIGRWLWAIERVRERTLKLADGLPAALLDWQGPDGKWNAIGSLLCHMAEVEISVAVERN